MSRNIESPKITEQPQEVFNENLQLRRTLRDLGALTSLPAIWNGLDRETIVRNLADVLLNILSLDLIYVRLKGPPGSELIEFSRDKHRLNIAQEPAVMAALEPLLQPDQEELPSTVRDPFETGLLQAAVVRFGASENQGILIACSRSADFPTEQDRLLLEVGTNQTALVMQRWQAEMQVHDQREWLRVTLASIGDAVIATDMEGRVTYLNPIAEDLTGWTLNNALDQPVESVFTTRSEDTLAVAENSVRKVLCDGGVVGKANRSLLIAKDGTERPIGDSAAPILDSAGRIIGVVMVFRDVTAQRRAEQYHGARLAVTQALNQTATVESAAGNILQSICENLAWDAGLFWAINADSDQLSCQAHWHRSNSPLTSFITASCDHTFKCGEGLPGRVWATDAPIWLSELRHDQNFPRLASTTKEQVQSAFACPVVVGQQTRGVIEFFAQRIREPDSDFSELMRSVAVSFGQFIERQTAENELRRSKQELAEFFENAAIGLHWVGPDGIILKANRAELDMLGYRRDEYVGRPITDFHADPHVIEDILNQLKAGKKLVDYPARLRCKDGSIKDTLIDSSVRWHQGEFVHTQCFTRDITQSKYADRELADTRSRLNAALEAGAVATWSWDIVNNQLYTDEALSRLFNLPPSGGKGRPLDEYLPAIHPDDLPQVSAALERSLDSGGDYAADYRLLQADGSIRWIAARGRAQRDASGRAVRMPGVLVDISERKTLEEELRLRVDQLAEADRRKDELLASLRESEEMLRLLANTIPQLAWMAQPDGAVFWYNQRWYEYTATTPEQMQGWRWASVHDPQILPTVLERWNAAIAAGECFEMVFPLLGADGQYRPFLTRVIPLRDANGRILNWFGTNTDISEIKRMENALRNADRRKDEFLATLAHELRNPLAPIRNSLEILKMPSVDASTAQRTREMMERQVHHLVRLVDDLLDVSRVMRGKIALRKQPIELASAITRAVETIHSRIESQGHQLDISIPSESLLLHADPVRLAQVVGNLLANAAKYTEADGHIWVEAKRLEDQVSLTVRDNGIGIAPEVLPQVFELFMQADHAAIHAQGGLGIGLTLVKNLVEMHGGTVQARSAGLGKGCEFEIRLPLTIAEPCQLKAPVDDEPRQETLAGHRLMVVDDNEDAATSLAMLLRLQGHEVQVAHDGPSALSMAVSYQPVLIFLDIGMPGMDGCEVARRVRKQSGLEDVVLVALTGWGQQEDRRRTAAAGFNHHLVKPLELPALESLLKGLRTSETCE